MLAQSDHVTASIQAGAAPRPLGGVTDSAGAERATSFAPAARPGELTRLDRQPPRRPHRTRVSDGRRTQGTRGDRTAGNPGAPIPESPWEPQPSPDPEAQGDDRDGAGRAQLSGAEGGWDPGRG